MRKKTSKYKGVSYQLDSRTRSRNANGKPWKVKLYLPGSRTPISSSAETEEEAALIYDKLCIKNGLPPVNRLRPVKK